MLGISRKKSPLIMTPCRVQKTLFPYYSIEQGSPRAMKFYFFLRKRGCSSSLCRYRALLLMLLLSSASSLRPLSLDTIATDRVLRGKGLWSLLSLLKTRKKRVYYYLLALSPTIMKIDLIIIRREPTDTITAMKKHYQHDPSESSRIRRQLES